jgi:hypothetical protein
MAEKKAKLADNKTKPTNDNVEDFLNTITPAQKREDSFVLLELMKKASKEEPTLWSNSFIGFGIRRHKSPTSGREADWFRIGFAPRKTNLTLYFGTYVDNLGPSLEKLGKFKTGMGCVYVNKLADIDMKVLKKMIEEGAKSSV